MSNNDRNELEKRVDPGACSPFQGMQSEEKNPTIHGDHRGLYMLFPDQSMRRYPADSFPNIQLKKAGYFLRWVEFMKGLFHILDAEEWQNISLRFGPYADEELFRVNIPPQGIDPARWQAACALARRIGGPDAVLV